MDHFSAASWSWEKSASAEFGLRWEAFATWRLHCRVWSSRQTGGQRLGHLGTRWPPMRTTIRPRWRGVARRGEEADGEQQIVAGERHDASVLRVEKSERPTPKRFVEVEQTKQSNIRISHSNAATQQRRRTLKTKKFWSYTCDSSKYRCFENAVTKSRTTNTPQRKRERT